MLDRGLSMSDSTSNAFQGDPRLQRFRDWMQINGVQSRFCEIRPSSNGENAGFGLFATKDNAQGVLMVTPLLLAITPMTVLQDPELGGHYCKLMEEGEVDDRLLIMLFLVIERARGRFSFWAPYLEILPFKFGTPLSFSEEELSELKGTHLFQATQQQRRALSSSFNEKVKAFADTALSSVESERREVELQDFMWANSVFWTRALNIPCPHSFVFPSQLPIPPALRPLQSVNEPDSQQPAAPKENTPNKVKDELTACPSMADKNDMGCNDASTHRNQIIADLQSISEVSKLGIPEENNRFAVDLDSTTHKKPEESSAADTDDVKIPSSVWVEGLVPGIDFCNHDLKAVALWEVDGPEGSVTGVPNSMYLVTGGLDVVISNGSEIFISYGNKSNEELLYLYGFVLVENPDDYLMIYFPKQALEYSVCSDTKSQLLEQLNLPLRWLVPSSELKRGFCCESNLHMLSETPAESGKPIITGHSWTGHRKSSALAEKVVFPEELLTALRIVSMEEDEVYHVVAMLEEISDPEAGRIPTDADIKAAVWETCGNAGALQLLVDLLTSKMMELEEGTGTEDMDSELLAKDSKARSQTKEQSRLKRTNGNDELQQGYSRLSDNKRSSVVYRMGQKCLTRRFLQEAETALHVCVDHIS